MLTDHDAFENLNPLLVAFLDQRVNTNTVTGTKIRKVLTLIRLVDFDEKLNEILACWRLDY